MAKKRRIFLCLGLFAFHFCTALPAFATLGEAAASIESDRSALLAVKKNLNSHTNYSVLELGSISNNVREYVSTSGIVFAVAWSGKSPPDLKPLLGSYAPEYAAAQALNPRKPGRRNLKLETARLVVEHWGHMRNLQGHAYDPSLLPEGVSANEIK